MQAHMRDSARFSGSYIPVQVGDDSKWKVIALNFIFKHQLPDFKHEVPVAAYNTFDQAFVGKVIESFILAVALAGGTDKG